MPTRAGLLALAPCRGSEQRVEALDDLSVVLLSLTSTGTGTQRWDLSASLPLESSSQLLTEQVLMVEQELEDVVETQQIEVRSSLRGVSDR